MRHFVASFQTRDRLHLIGVDRFVTEYIVRKQRIQAVHQNSCALQGYVLKKREKNMMDGGFH